MNKKIILPVVIAVIIGSAVLGVDFVKAQDTNNPHQSIIQRLVDKFGLNKDEVTAVFQEDKTAREAEMKTKMEERLNKAVTDGKITEAQKQAIIAKQEELRANKPEDMKNLTQEERKAKMDAQRTDLNNWAQTNGIDLKQLGGLMGGFGKGMGGGRGIWGNREVGK